MLSRLRDWARTIKRDVVMLWLAARDPRTPWQAKVVGGFVAAYALSPIDLIPDFVPVLGYLDDLLLVPVGIWIAVKMIPPLVVADLRVEADGIVDRPTSRSAAVVVVTIWIVGSLIAGRVLLRLLPDSVFRSS